MHENHTVRADLRQEAANLLLPHRHVAIAEEEVNRSFNLHLQAGLVAQLDPLGSAKSLAAAIQQQKHDLVLTGLQSDDHGFGQTGVLLAGVLDVPHATIIMAIEVDGQKMKLKRELEAGWFQHIECPLPAVLTIQSGINKVRYATLKGIMAAKKNWKAAEARPTARSDVLLATKRRPS